MSRFLQNLALKVLAFTMKIYMIFFIQPIFADLLGQNRLGNNRWISKFSRSEKINGDLFGQLLANLTKTRSGRMMLTAYIKQQPTKKMSKKFGRRVNYRKFGY